MHEGAVPAVQMPFAHASVPLQMFPSVHEVPFETGTCWQPFTGSQLSMLHWLWSSQFGGTPAVQTPA